MGHLLSTATFAFFGQGPRAPDESCVKPTPVLNFCRWSISRDHQIVKVGLAQAGRTARGGVDLKVPPQLEKIGNFTIVRVLGQGAMGTVYLARQEMLGRELALKVLNPEFTSEPEFVDRFRREGRVAARLNHPYIVPIFDADCKDGHYFIAMEYAGEKTMRDLMASEGRLRPIRAVALVDQILQALEHAHQQGVVHRDIKPSNILMRNKDEIAITDFSVAKLADDIRLTRTGTTLGTPEYMAPELFDGATDDPRADLYATGLIFYELLTGSHPFRRNTIAATMKAHLLEDPPPPREVDPGLPREFDDWLKRALAKDPAARFTDAAEMRRELRRLQPDMGPALGTFLERVSKGEISMDEAIKAQDMVLAAIDQGFKKPLSVLMVSIVELYNKDEGELVINQTLRQLQSLLEGLLDKHHCLRFNWSGDGLLALFEHPEQAFHVAGEAAGNRFGSLRLGLHHGELYLDPHQPLGEASSRVLDQAGHLQKDSPPGRVRLSDSFYQKVRHLGDFVEIGRNRDQVLVYEYRQKKAETPPAPPVASVPAAKTASSVAEATPSRKVWPGIPVGAAAVACVLVGEGLGNELGAIIAGLGAFPLMGLILFSPFALAYNLLRRRWNMAVQSGVAGLLLFIIAWFLSENL